MVYLVGRVEALSLVVLRDGITGGVGQVMREWAIRAMAQFQGVYGVHAVSIGSSSVSIGSRS